MISSMILESTHAGGVSLACPLCSKISALGEVANHIPTRETDHTGHDLQLTVLWMCVCAFVPFFFSECI